MNFTKTKKEGNTLIEFVLYIGLFVVFFTSLFFVLDIFYKNKTKNTVALEVKEQGLFVSQFINQEIRNAQNISSPLSGDSLESLSLEPFDSSRGSLVFYLSDGSLFFSEGSTLNEKLHSNNVLISDLVFLNKNETISFSFKVSYKSGYVYNQDFSGLASLNVK
jgi:hypothetical protein